ncbi:hypothetical protein K461DRAFT_267514 [Myriangium duriaei CBS 260.36]|uniref:Transcription factor domain-containing protein n=1 Tax=Myriangium duriaei CBS 260.36 TaxID=1168546 RepID=A0A9P4J2C5_9PEZI|nr:hypothetical protein K461DRAFT_267514 [Myriangium duriaei CBS 260.36]
MIEVGVAKIVIKDADNPQMQAGVRGAQCLVSTATALIPGGFVALLNAWPLNADSQTVEESLINDHQETADVYSNDNVHETSSVSTGTAGDPTDASALEQEQDVVPSADTATTCDNSSALIDHHHLIQSQIEALKALLDTYQRQVLSLRCQRMSHADHGSRPEECEVTQRPPSIIGLNRFGLNGLIDVCDKNRTFGVEVPRRAMQLPQLRSAILAFSCRHIALLSDTRDDESPEHVGKTLQLMITILHDTAGQWDENLFATMILLRLHEEMHAHDDQRCHLYGITQLLNTTQSFASLGGLREAAAWVFLRQRIYVAFTEQRPLDVDLENYKASTAFHDQDDESWANRIIYLFALILNQVLQSQGTMNVDVLAGLDKEVEHWMSTKPWHFSSLWESNLQDDTPGKLQPLLMSHPAHVVGLQYYNMAKMTLTIFDTTSVVAGFDRLEQQRAMEVVVRRHLRTIMSLSVSNEIVENANFQTSHSLFVCGTYFRDPLDQQVAVDVLREIKCRSGWNTDYVIEYLFERWRT